MDFGTVGIPASGSQALTLSASSSLETGTGTLLYGSPSHGAYTLTSSGSGSTSITIDIMNVSSMSANLTLDAFTGVYMGGAISSFPSSPLSLPSSSGTPMLLGATETVTSGMQPGSLNPTFDIVVIVN